MATGQTTLATGERLHGFRVIRTTPLANLRSTAIELEHEGTGAKLLHLYNADAENLFSVTFPTPPPDNTGVPHILEHAVLGGSKKFKVKDPFFEMVKMSMATFINAMTDSDNTMYPVASNVRQDFYNLADVYFDAVFHPELTENTFKREGHHLEFAKPGDRTSDLIVKGIVYNEMKGAYSSPDSRVGDYVSRHLWPDTLYGLDAGGDPDVIPTLTYRDFLHFHETHYHPSNAYFFFYGDIPTADHLAFLEDRLNAFERRPVKVDFKRQPRWSEPRKATEAYPIAKTDPTTGKTYHVLSWIVGEQTDVERMLAFSVIQQILLGHQGAPLRKALIDSKLGEDLTQSYYSPGRLESSFHVGIKGSEADRAQAFEALVLKTLGEIVENGIDNEDIDSAFQQLAYRYLEISGMYPLNLMSRATSLWIYGGDPLTLLRADELMAQLRAKSDKDQRFFTRIIQDQLLDNTHRLLLTAVPDRTFQEKKDADFAEAMRRKKRALDDGKLAEIDAQAAELERLMNTPNPPEALAALPQLRVRDLPRRPREIPTRVETLGGGVTLLNNDVFANGINYLFVNLDLDALPDDLYRYLRLYGDCVHKMGAAGNSYVRMAERVAANTGGLSFGAGVTTMANNPNSGRRSATFSIRFLDGKAEAALGVLHDFLFALDPRDEARLMDVLMQAKAADRSRIASNGLGLALSQASRQMTVESALSDVMHGLPQLRLIRALADRPVEGVMEKIEAIRGFLTGGASITASFTGSSHVTPIVHKTLERWARSMGSGAGNNSARQPHAAQAPPRDGLAGPMDVAYCTTVLPAPHLSDPDAPLLSVGARLVGMGYVLEEVRFKGTAYGGGCGYNALGRMFSFHSYRDPWVKRTLDVFKGAADYVRNSNWTQTDVDRAIIGTAKEAERPIRPADATGAALSRHLLGDSAELRAARHESLLGATAAKVKGVMSTLFEKNMDKAGVCVVSSRPRLEEANAQLGAGALSIQEIFES